MSADSNDLEIPEGYSKPGAVSSPFTIGVDVAWGEMDSLGHVNNAVYLRWFENVRFHYFEHTRVNEVYVAERVGPILARAELDFLAPVTFPDRLLVSTRVTKLGNRSFTMHNRIWSTADGREVARGVAVIVMVDYARNESVRVPEPIREAIRAIEGEGLDEAKA